MLDWAPNTQIQEIGPVGSGYARIGTIGDGNCMIHSMFTAASPTYRSFVKRDRQKIADMFRDVLRERIDDIRAEVDAIYFEIGGSGALEDSFVNLADPAGRTEIDMELGPAIAHLYGHNFMAVTLNEALDMEPVCLTLNGYDPSGSLPTILINYIGGSTNIGKGSAAFVDMGGAGHFEVIIRPVFAAEAASGSARRTTRSAKKKTTTLDNFHTTYTFADAATMADIMALFQRACGHASSGSRHSVSSGTRAAIAAVSSLSPHLKTPKSASSGASGRTVSPETLALLAALNVKSSSSSKKKSTKKTSSQRRRTTQKKRKSP